MRLLIVFILLMSNSFANEAIDIKNLVINKEPKRYGSLTFLDTKNDIINLENYDGSLILLNFWATWCLPCKEEMPSLDKLHAKDGIFVFPINLEDKNLKKTDKFYDDLNITNLNIYFDEGLKLTKAFSIRGVPTTIIFNKNKDEVARIKGSVDFSDKKFISWLDSIE